MNKIKKVLLFAMSFVMATGLFTGCFVMPQTNSSSSESTVSESSSESSTESSVESSVESSTESSVESSVESSKESSIESSVESSIESSTESSVESSTESSVESSVESSIESSVESSVDSTTDSSVEVQKYNFTVVVGEGAEDTTVEVEPGTMLDLPADPVVEGKTFAGWIDGEGNAVEEGAVMPEADFTIYATWNITPYTLTIKADGQDDVTLTFGVEFVPADEEAGTPEIIGIDMLDDLLNSMLPEPTEETEYAFEGRPEIWVLEDTTITLVEKARTYWLTIRDGNPMDPDAYYEELKLEAGATIELPAREDVEGKTFIGWFYTDLETGEEFAAPETMPKFDIAIYAKWELETKTLTINKVDGSVETYAIAVETEYDWFNPITGLDDIPYFLEDIKTEPFSEFYTVSYEGIPETWELKDYTITEVAKSSIAYFDRLNKTWAQKPNNQNNYWDGCEGITSVEHLVGAVTKVTIDATKFTADEVAAGNAGWAGWGDNRQLWVTFAVPVNGTNLHKSTVSLEVKFENMTPSFNALVANTYTGDDGYDYVMSAEKGCAAAGAEDLGDGWYRFTVNFCAGDTATDAAFDAAEYLLFSFDNTNESVDKSLPSSAYIRNLTLNCIHEYSAECDPTCELCGEERYDVEHIGLLDEWISDEWGMHYLLCGTCGSQVNYTFCELTYVYTKDGHYEVCDLCGYETEMYAHDIWAGYNDEGHYDEGCYCGYIASDIIPHDPEIVYDAWDHWEECACGWSGEWIPHSGELEMAENGHKVLGCSGCDFEGSDEVVPHTYGDWTVNAEHDWLSERECGCGAKQVIKNRLDVPAQYFLVEEPTLDLTAIFSEGFDPNEVFVTAATATYTYWDYKNVVAVENYTHDFYADNYWLTVNDDGTVTYTLDSEATALAPYFYGYKVIVLTFEFDNYTTLEIPVTVTAVTKVIDTAEELQDLGVGGGLLASNGRDYGGNGNGATKGNDVVGYYLLGDDIDATGIYFAAGYVTGQSYFRGTFDGNGHTISNVIVSEGGIFGGMYDATVKNVNFKNVEYHGNGAPLPNGGKGYNNTTQYGQYFGLFAHYAAKTTITDVNVQVSMLNTNTNLGKQTALLVFKNEHGGNVFNNINIDASGLMINNVLGFFAGEDKVTYTNIAIKAAGYSTVGFTDSGSTPLTALPNGITFEKADAVSNWNGAKLPLYEGDVTELGFAEGTIVYKHTAPAASSSDIWSVMTANAVKLTKEVDEDYASIQFVLGRDFTSASTAAFFSWMNVMPAGATEKVYAAGGWLNQNGTTGASTESHFNASENGFKFVVIDAEGNIVTASNPLKAGTVYTLRVYCNYLVELQLCVYAISGEPMDVYFANPSSGNGKLLYSTNDGPALPIYTGDVTELGFAEGTTVQYKTDEYDLVGGSGNWWQSGKEVEIGGEILDCSNNVKRQSVQPVIYANADYSVVCIEFALSEAVASGSVFHVWAYDEAKTHLGGGVVSVGQAWAESGFAGAIYDKDGNIATSLEANTVYVLKLRVDGAYRYNFANIAESAMTTYIAENISYEN